MRGSMLLVGNKNYLFMYNLLLFSWGDRSVKIKSNKCVSLYQNSSVYHYPGNVMKR